MAALSVADALDHHRQDGFVVLANLIGSDLLDALDGELGWLEHAGAARRRGGIRDVLGRPRRRRVLHLELCAEALPHGLRWRWRLD